MIPLAIFIGFILGFITVMIAFMTCVMESKAGKVLLVFFLVLLIIVSVIPIVYYYGGDFGSFIHIPSIITDLSLNLTDYLVGMVAGAGLGGLFARTL